MKYINKANTPDDADARRAVPPVICYPTDSLPTAGASILAAARQSLEKIDEVIFTKIRERADEIERVNRELTDHINMTEKRLLNEIKSLRNDIGPRINVLEKWKWVILGGSIVVGWVLSRNFIHIMQMINGS